MTVHTLVISSSLNVESKSRLLARVVYDDIPQASGTKRFMDLREHPLPLCDGGKAYGDANVKIVEAQIKEADCIIVGFPVYNYSCSAALKNLVELTGRAWENKVVGFVCAAGGKSSYMSVMNIATSLMLDFRSVIVPRFVYADGEGFSGVEISDPSLRKRLEELALSSTRFAQALKSVN